jgi:hypothetical protein
LNKGVIATMFSWTSAFSGSICARIGTLPGGPRKPLSAVILAAVVGALTACAGPPAAPQPHPATTSGMPRLLETVALHLPVQDYLATNAQVQMVSRARDVLVQECMHTFGFTYPGPRSYADHYGPRSLVDRRYGITDIKLAAQDGYGMGARDPARQKRPAAARTTPSWETALTGQGRSQLQGRKVPDGGCYGQADRTLDGSTAASPNNVAQALQFESYARSQQDPRVVAVFADWSSCMAARGYQYTSPMTAMADPRFEHVAGHTADANEIAVARADIACKGQVNVIGVWFTVESDYQRDRIANDTHAFLDLRRNLEREVDSARTILTGTIITS